MLSRYMQKVFGHSPGEFRHDFMIRPLVDAQPFQGRSELYLCRKCTWKFAVKGGRVAVLDGQGGIITGAESDRRMETFACGPCPAMTRLYSHEVNGTGPVLALRGSRHA